MSASAFVHILIYNKFPQNLSDIEWEYFSIRWLYLFSEIKGRKLEKQLAKIQEKPAQIVSIRDEEEYCPKCFCRLTDQALMALQRGSLVLCTSYSDAWIYQVPALPENVLQM